MTAKKPLLKLPVDPSKDPSRKSSPNGLEVKTEVTQKVVGKYRGKDKKEKTGRKRVSHIISTLRN